MESTKKRGFNVGLFSLVKWLPLGLANRVVSRFYDLVNLGSEESAEFINYGYADAEGQKPDVDTTGEQRYDYLSRQLYRKLTSTVDLRGKDVLEVGCGRGGGAAYVKRELGPRSLTAIDLSPKAVEFCTRHYAIDQLVFTLGAAETMPFPDQSFDIVMNVESSHTYHSMPKFLAEARRVMKTGGVLLIVDFRHRDDLPLLREQFEHAGLTTRAEENITKHVLWSLALTSDVKIDRFKDVMPRRRRAFLEEFAAVKGSRTYDLFRRGELQYWHFVLEATDQSWAAGT